MVDIHSHIIFAVDDGAKTAADTEQILSDSYSQGVRVIIATPHRRKNMFETSNQVIVNNFEKVKQIAKSIADDLQIHLGAEIYYTSDIIEKLKNVTYWTLAGSQYALIEFSNYTPYSTIYGALNDILLLGIRPVIAHIERYDCLAENKQKIDELIELGCLVQINASNTLPIKLFGDAHKRYKKRVNYLLKEDLVHFIASDVHNTTSRKTDMAVAYKQIEKKYGSDRARLLFIDNPLKIVKREVI